MDIKTLKFSIDYHSNPSDTLSMYMDEELSDLIPKILKEYLLYNATPNKIVDYEIHFVGNEVHIYVDVRNDGDEYSVGYLIVHNDSNYNLYKSDFLEYQSRIRLNAPSLTLIGVGDDLHSEINVKPIVMTLEDSVLIMTYCVNPNNCRIIKQIVYDDACKVKEEEFTNNNSHVKYYTEYNNVPAIEHVLLNGDFVLRHYYTRMVLKNTCWHDTQTNIVFDKLYDINYNNQPRSGYASYGGRLQTENNLVPENHMIQNTTYDLDGNMLSVVRYHSNGGVQYYSNSITGVEQSYNMFGEIV